MIFITLGMQFFPFNRVTVWLDQMLDQGLISETVLFQHGATSVQSLNHPFLTKVPSLSRDQMILNIRNSSLVLSHAGQGSTRNLAELGSCFVLLPRLQKYGEHIDDHQLGFARAVAKLGATYCTEFDELVRYIHEPPAPFAGELLPGPPLVDYLVTRFSY
jgi:UDP-N-acetylglucosamine transferase subunit ALG13